MTTTNIFEFSIDLVTGSAASGELLPNDAHPYDHFIVRATLILAGQSLC